MGLPKDCTFLSNTKAAWTGDCKNLDMKYSCDLDFSLDLKEWTSTGVLDSKTSVNQSQLQESAANKGCHGNSQPFNPEGLSDSGCHDNINCVQHEGFPGNSGCCSNNNSLLTEHRLKYPMCTSEFQWHKNYKIKEETNAIVNNVEGRETDTKYKTGKETPEILRQTDTYIHGFIGYFTSVLYKDIIIDTRHTSEDRNSFHWECYFVPLSKPVLVEPGTQVKLRMNRNCEEYVMDGMCAGLKLWYEWQVLIRQKSDMNSLDVSEYKPKLKDKKTKFNNEPANLGFLCQDEHSVPKTSKKSSSEDTRSEEEFDSFKERDEQCSVHKFSVQNQNGESDAVFLTWHKT